MLQWGYDETNDVADIGGPDWSAEVPKNETEQMARRRHAPTRPPETMLGPEGKDTLFNLARLASGLISLSDLNENYRVVPGGFEVRIDEESLDYLLEETRKASERNP